MDDTASLHSQAVTGQTSVDPEGGMGERNSNYSFILRALRAQLRLSGTGSVTLKFFCFFLPFVSVVLEVEV